MYKGSLFYLFLKLVQINIIFSDNSYILYVHVIQVVEISQNEIYCPKYYVVFFSTILLCNSIYLKLARRIDFNRIGLDSDIGIVVLSLNLKYVYILFRGQCLAFEIDYGLVCFCLVGFNWYCL